MPIPATACTIQNELGCKQGVAAFDLAAGCSGFIYAQSVAKQFVFAANARRNVLVDRRRIAEQVRRLGGSLDLRDLRRRCRCRGA